MIRTTRTTRTSRTTRTTPSRRVARLTRTVLAAALLTAVSAAVLAPAASASKGGGGGGGGGETEGGKSGCEGGGFSLVLPGSTITPAPGQDLKQTIAASRLGSSFLVKGKYVEFTVTPSTFGVTNWTLTGAPNAADLTSGQRTVVMASKTPDLRGASLTSGVEVRLRDGDLVMKRTGSGVAMKIQAKDCAAGGIFQIEPERGDGTATTFTHVLAPAVFYYDNPLFRQRIGTTVPFVTDAGATIQMPVTARVNFGSDAAPKLVGRDSSQLATRIASPTCTNVFGTQCGGISFWSVASGGRMGQVMGADSVEVSPAATDCATDCQAQNQIRGRAVVLGFPTPVPAASRLTPRLP